MGNKKQTKKVKAPVETHLVAPVYKDGEGNIIANVAEFDEDIFTMDDELISKEDALFKIEEYENAPDDMKAESDDVDDDKLDAEMADTGLVGGTIKGVLGGWLEALDFNNAVSDGLATNREAMLDGLARKAAHGVTESIRAGIVGCIPEKTAMGTFARSETVKTVSYAVISQCVMLVCNAMRPIHKGFGRLAKGAATNSQRRMLAATKIAKRIEEMSPVLGEVFKG